MRFLSALSDLMVPVLIFYVVGLGLLMKQDVFGDFLNGAKDGMRTVIGIVPTLIGLMAAVGVLRSSGFLEDFGKLLGTVLEPAGIPSALVPLGVVRRRTGGFDYDVVHGDGFLYDGGLFRSGPHQKNAVHTGGCIALFPGRNGGQYCACRSALTIFSDHISEMC